MADSVGLPETRNQFTYALPLDLPSCKIIDFSSNVLVIFPWELKRVKVLKRDNENFYAKDPGTIPVGTIHCIYIKVTPYRPALILV